MITNFASSAASQHCTLSVQCDVCGNPNHPTAMHMEGYNKTENTPLNKETAQGHGGEQPHEVTAKCNEICGNNFSGHSCAKNILVRVYSPKRPEQNVILYVLLDDQSNATLAKSKFFDIMEVPMSVTKTYSLTSCAGRKVMSGRKVGGYIVEAIDGSSCLELPLIMECGQIPTERSEIPTPEIVENHPHLRDITILPLDPQAHVLLLIGRDLPEVHHVQDQRTSPRGSLFAHKTPLGWVLVGNVCLRISHLPDDDRVMKTFVNPEGSCSVYEDCEYNLSLQDDDTHLFKRERHDNSVGPSIEDVRSLQIMDSEFTQNPSGSWVTPLPFRNPSPLLPNNCAMALKRAVTLLASLRWNQTKRAVEHQAMPNLPLR